jgi:hypothetical protein
MQQALRPFRTHRRHLQPTRPIWIWSITAGTIIAIGATDAVGVTGAAPRSFSGSAIGIVTVATTVIIETIATTAIIAGTSRH